MARRYLVLHGWENHRPPDHWQFWLTERLRERGEQVLYPQLPSPDDPLLGEWLAVVRSELRMLGHGERIVVCHSLGCLLWLRHAARMTTTRWSTACCSSARRAPPPCPPRWRRSSRSRATPRRSHAPCAAAPSSSARAATRGAPRARPRRTGERLGLDVHVVEGGGHLSADDGYGAWPDVEQWALTGAFSAETALAA